MDELRVLFQIIGFLVLAGVAMVVAVAVAVVFCVCLLAYGLLVGGSWLGARLRR